MCRPQGPIGNRDGVLYEIMDNETQGHFRDIIVDYPGLSSALWIIGFILRLGEDGDREEQNSHRCGQMETVGATRGETNVAGSQMALRSAHVLQFDT
jgi:hypothetical protein